MVKLVHFIHGMGTGGAETLVKNYMMNFDKNKFDTVVLCLNHCEKSPYEDILNKMNVRMIFIQDYLPFKKRSNVFQKIVNYPLRYILIPRLIKQENPDILHTHMQINKFLVFTKMKHGMKLFHTIHNELSTVYPRNDIRKRVDYYVTKRFIKRYGMKLVVLHKKMKKEADEMFGVSNSMVLNNGVDVRKILRPKGKQNTRVDLNIPESAFVVGNIGRFSSQKNHEFLTDIFIEIQKKKKDTFLLLIGDGDGKNRIAKKLEDEGLKEKCLILSNRDDVPDLLNAMDVFVFPSLYEGLPLSLIEAQIAKKPCFISDTIDGHAVISNLVTSLSLDDGPEKWAEAILKYKKPKKIEVNDEDWDIKKITKQLEQLYLDALAEKENGEKQD